MKADEGINDQWYQHYQVARWWLYGDDSNFDSHDPMLQRFQKGRPQQQRNWLERVIAAAKACDPVLLPLPDQNLETQ